MRIMMFINLLIYKSDWTYSNCELKNQQANYEKTYKMTNCKSFFRVASKQKREQKKNKKKRKPKTKTEIIAINVSY